MREPPPAWRENREAAGFLVASLFVCLAAMRDVYLAGVFQQISPLHVAVVAFGLCSLIFLPVTLLRGPQRLRRVVRHPLEVFWINVTSAVAWLAYLYALRLAEPALVQVLWAGIGPLAVTRLERIGALRTRSVRLSRGEEHLHLGIFASLVLTTLVILTGLSGSGTQRAVLAPLGVGLALISGVSITINTMLCKRLNEVGVSPDALVSIRFVGVVLAALMLGLLTGDTGFVSWSVTTGSSMAVAALLLIVLPVYVNQIGISLASPITVRGVLALGPVLVFLLQLWEGRLMSSPYSLTSIVLYSTFALSAAFVRQRATLAAAPAGLEESARIRG